MSGFDLIGDVHGCCDSLEALLQTLGYKKRNGVYRHDSRQVIFLGDLVDRGPKIRETLHLVRNMVEQGSARIVLGNHEVSAIRYMTPARPGSGRTFLREHTERTNYMIRETLDQFQAYQDEWDDFLQWFYEIPLFIEQEFFRVVHACWDHCHINAFVEHYNKTTIDEEMMHEPLSSLARQTVEILTRGANMMLPGGEEMVSSDGYTRCSFRTKFWHDSPETYGDLAFQPDPLPEHIHHLPLSGKERNQSMRYEAHERPLFVGHYWCQGKPEIITHNIACLDYSAINGGKLVAYRMDENERLDDSRFVWVDSLERIDMGRFGEG
jgi:hypothetical protein